MKYRIDGPAHEGAPEVWEVVNIDPDIVMVICWSEELATKIMDLLEAEAPDGGG